MTCLHPDVRCEQSWGAKLGVKPKALLFHPGATGEGKIGLGQPLQLTVVDNRPDTGPCGPGSTER